MLNSEFLRIRTRLRPAVIGFALSSILAASFLVQAQEIWTLEKSIRRVLEVAPEIQTADAEIGIRQGALQQADDWPNPSIELQVDDKLGSEDAAGGYDFTQLAISQPLPMNRLAHQRSQAEAGLAGAEAQRRHQQLLLEYKVAQSFHILQLAEAKLQLATQRLQQAIRYQDTGRQGAADDPLIRYLTPLENMRLDIVQQTAKQTVDLAEGEFNEAAASFKALLAIPIDSAAQLMPLALVEIPAEFRFMEQALQDHPALEAGKQALRSAQAGIEVARSQRFDDPTLTLFTGKDFLANDRQQTSGVMLNLQIPLWNQNDGGVSQARYTARQAQAELNLQQRELQTRLQKSYTHLGHLIEQAEHYRTKLLQPAQQVFELTHKGFMAGELNILSLIDANNTYFDAKERYLELLQEGWLELADLRQSTGLSLLANNTATHSGEVK